MAVGKLSQQVNRTTSQGRPTRTERLVIQSQARKEDARFRQLSEEAKKVEEEKFKDKVQTTNYTEYVPSNFLFKGEPINKWYQLTPETRERLIQTSKNVVGIQRSKTTTIPFTIDEGENSYTNIYQSMSDNLKQFFPSPQTVKEERASRIQASKAKLETQIEKTKAKLAESREDKREDKEYFYGKYLEGLTQGKERLEQGEDIKWGDIDNFASEYAYGYLSDFEQKKKAKKTPAPTIIDVDKAISEAQSGGSFMRVREEKKGVPVKEKIFAVSPKGQYTLISQSTPKYKPSTLSASSIPTANITQLYKVGNLKLTFTGQEKLYKTQSNELVTQYGSIGMTEEQALKQQEEEQAKYRLESQKKAIDYLQDTQFSGKASLPSDTEQSKLMQVIEFGKAGYSGSFFGGKTPLPDEFQEKRKPVRLTLTTPVPFSFFSMDFGTSLKAVQSERKKQLEASAQLSLITELDKLVEEAPEELRYDVQQEGIKILEKRGIRSELDKETNLISFDSDAFKPSKSFNVYQLEKAQAWEKTNLGKWYVRNWTIPKRDVKLTSSLPYQSRGSSFSDNMGKFTTPTTEFDLSTPERKYTISPYSAAVKGRIVGTEALKFYLVTKGFETAIAGAGLLYKGVKGTYTGLGGGTKITEATMRGTKITAISQPSAKLRDSAIGRILYKPEVLKKLGLATLYTGAAALFVVGKKREKEAYIERYGDTGALAFKYETIGEVAGFGAAIGEGVVKAQRIKKANKLIELKNYQRQINIKRLTNVKTSGQFSDFANFGYEAKGSGLKLKKGELSELSKIYSEVTGKPLKYAKKRIGESAISVQKLRVSSAAGFKPVETSRITVTTAEKALRGNKELGIEFTRSGKNVRNVVIKTSVARGKYGITSVFRKARVRKGQLTDEFLLEKIISSKVVKTRKNVISSDEFGTFRDTYFKTDLRLFKSFPEGKTRFRVGDVLKKGLPDYRKSDLIRYYKESGKLANMTSPKLRRGQFVTEEKMKFLESRRIERPVFKDVYIDRVKAKILQPNKYDFLQVGKSKRSISFKNSLRGLENMKFRLPRSRAFRTLKEPDIKEAVLKRLNANTQSSFNFKSPSARTSQTYDRSVGSYQGLGLYERTEQVAYTPMIMSDPKINIGTTRMIQKFATTSNVNLASTLALLTNPRQQQKSKAQLKAQLRTRQILELGTVQPTRQREETTTKQSQNLRTAISGALTFAPVTNISMPIDTPTTYTPPTRIKNPPADPYLFGFGTKSYVLSKLKKRKKEKGGDVFYYLPDFTTKALGLPPMEVSSAKEALKVIKQVQTGFEIRRGLRIRN